MTTNQWNLISHKFVASDCLPVWGQAIEQLCVRDAYCVLQLREICIHLAADMRREELRGKTLTLKLKSAATFEVRMLLCSS